MGIYELFFISSSNTFKKYCAGLERTRYFFQIKASDEVICGSRGLKHKELSLLVSMRFFKEITAPLHSFVKILAL